MMIQVHLHKLIYDNWQDYSNDIDIFQSIGSKRWRYIMSLKVI